MTETIYMPLLGEGIDVWRPVPAWRIGDDTYIVLRPDDYDPAIETWAFPPGSTVVCEPRRVSDGMVPAATRMTQPDRQTA
jgi:hypothetical protein